MYCVLGGVLVQFGRAGTAVQRDTSDTVVFVQIGWLHLAKKWGNSHMGVLFELIGIGKCPSTCSLCVKHNLVI